MVPTRTQTTSVAEKAASCSNWRPPPDAASRRLLAGFTFRCSCAGPLEEHLAVSVGDVLDWRFHFERHRRHEVLLEGVEHASVERLTAAHAMDLFEGGEGVRCAVLFLFPMATQTVVLQHLLNLTRDRTLRELFFWG